MLTTSDTKRRIALLALCLLLAIACIWLNWSLFASFWRSPVTSSFDGMSHFSVGEYYAKHTFPKTWGWTPLWFGGMPFPDFYPPLYYLVTALLYHLLPFSYTTVTKTFLCFLLTVLPGLSAWVGLAQTRNWWAALAAGCLTLLAISSPEYALGIAVYSTVTQGLFTQLLGYICLLLWYRYFFAADESLISRLLAGLFLFLLLLCNVHIVPVAVLFIVVWATLATIRSMRARDVRALYTELKSRAPLIFVPLAAVAFWYVPMLAHSQYFVTIALPSIPLSDSLALWLVPAGLTLVAVVWSIYRRDGPIQTVALVCILLALGSTFEIYRIFPSLPIQPARILASFTFLSCIPIGYLFGHLIGWVSRPALRWVAFAVLMTPFVWIQHIQRETAEDNLVDAPGVPWKVMQRFANSIQPYSSLASVEIPPTYLEDPTYLSINNLLSGAGVDTTYIAFRESSISSIFMTPVRNSLSQNTEAWGIETFLGFDSDFLSQEVNRHLDRAAFMGIGSFITSSAPMARVMEKSGRVLLEDRFDDWRLYGFPNPPARAEILRNQPAIFFGPVTFKKRSTWSYDYVRLQEEILFQDQFDTLVARAHEMSLDTSNDLDRFPIAIIFDYHYHDLERAYWRLKQYAETNTIICIRDGDPLSQRLAALAGSSKHVFIFDRLRGDTEDVQPLRREFQQIITLLSSQRRSVRIEEGQSIKAIHWDNERIVIELEKPPATSVPILIKSSYFPNWHRLDSNEPLYMVTPTFILTFARDNSVDVEFRADSSVWIGALISIVAVLATGMALVDGGGNMTHSRRASKIRIHGEYRIRNHDSSQHLLRRR